MSQKYSPEQWEELLREYREGNMIVKVWCKGKRIESDESLPNVSV